MDYLTLFIRKCGSVLPQLRTNVIGFLVTKLFMMTLNLIANRAVGPM